MPGHMGSLGGAVLGRWTARRGEDGWTGLTRAAGQHRTDTGRRLSAAGRRGVEASRHPGIQAGYASRDDSLPPPSTAQRHCVTGPERQTHARKEQSSRATRQQVSSSFRFAAPFLPGSCTVPASLLHRSCLVPASFLPPRLTIPVAHMAARVSCDASHSSIYLQRSLLHFHPKFRPGTSATAVLF